MAIPAYLWLKDDGGADIKGSVDVQGREGSIEVVALDHDVYIPTDNNTGKLTGTRTHKPFTFTKEIDASSPYLYKAVTTGQTLKTAEFKFYRINDAGPGYLNYLIHAQLPDTGWIRFDGVFSPEGRIVLRHLKQQERAY